MYDPESYDELNGDFVMAEHDDIINNNNEEHIPRSKGILKIINLPL